MERSIKKFLENFQSLVISSLDEHNLPFTSYAPFVRKDNKFYVYLSSMAKHSHNLTKNKNSSIFFIEDEQECENIFARKRVVYQCTTKKQARDTEEFKELISLFESKHGETVSMLKNMKDFSFFEFEVIKGEAILGFGKAFNLEKNNIFELIDRKDLKGHQK
ncbi:heme iron utilization protein [Arcobacter sp. CECT 8983]|uniref:HugZ family pyridoxamine 5'-phosphate oxidase n=1 Tax=Arcobacter sp. CECT 8983 TaxID=2044508 RepID=UPI00100C1ADD|nr:pyridoxamine 5'-phosphate oxidase family protein [Arcobacter sp. CECT 8983]RXJ89063.1 heme iron utilization protein [Arcobacter sp. CECT 8983]